MNGDKERILATVRCHCPVYLDFVTDNSSKIWSQDEQCNVQALEQLGELGDERAVIAAQHGIEAQGGHK